MKLRWPILAAMLAVAVLALAVGPAPAGSAWLPSEPASPDAPDARDATPTVSRWQPEPGKDWQKGFAFWGRSVGLGSRQGIRSLRHLTSVGANTVSPVVTWWVAHPGDPHLHRRADTPSDRDLAALADEAHRLGLQVVLRLHVDSEDGQWRARINPDDKDAWFAEYGAVLNHYAELAEAHGIEGIVIGAELCSLSGPAYTDYWRSMIAEVRQRFSGFLTYSAQWGSAPPGSLSDPFREYEQIEFWSDLDYLGISAYFELVGDGSSPQFPDLLAGWDEWRRLRVEPFQARYDMPLIFTEVGYRSADSAALHPWDSGSPARVNLQLQADLYAALFESWSGVPWFRGAYFWFWPVATGEIGPAELDYPPNGKPAEQVIRRWYRMLDDMEQRSLKPGDASGTISAGEGR